MKKILSLLLLSLFFFSAFAAEGGKPSCKSPSTTQNPTEACFQIGKSKSLEPYIRHEVPIYFSVAIVFACSFAFAVLQAILAHKHRAITYYRLNALVIIIIYGINRYVVFLKHEYGKETGSAETQSLSSPAGWFSWFGSLIPGFNMVGFLFPDFRGKGEGIFDRGLQPIFGAYLVFLYFYMTIFGGNVGAYSIYFLVSVVVLVLDTLKSFPSSRRFYTISSIDHDGNNALLLLDWGAELFLLYLFMKGLMGAEVPKDDDQNQTGLLATMFAFTYGFILGGTLLVEYAFILDTFEVKNEKASTITLYVMQPREILKAIDTALVAIGDFISWGFGILIGMVKRDAKSGKVA